MKSLLYAPAITEYEDLHNQLVRIAWYLFHLRDCQFLIVTDLCLDAVSIEDFIDSEVAERVRELVRTGRIKAIEGWDLSECQGVIAWKVPSKAMASIPPGIAAEIDHKSIPVYNVDRDHRMEGSLYIDLANKLSRSEPDVTLYEQRFLELAKDLSCSNSYLFCTGPSV
jgi:hypothetical protein